MSPAGRAGGAGRAGRSGLLVLFAGAVAAACSNSSAPSAGSTTRPGPVAVSRSTMAATTTSAPGAITSTPVTVTTVPTSSHVGATLSLSSAPYTADLTLARVIEDPSITATPGIPGQPVTRSNGRHFVALQFVVDNTGATALYDGGQEHETNLTPWVVTPDSQAVYSAAATVAGCTPTFGLQLAPGAAATVCSVFQLPSGVDPVYASVQMATGIGDDTVNWRIP